MLASLHRCSVSHAGLRGSNFRLDQFQPRAVERLVVAEQGFAERQGLLAAQGLAVLRVFVAAQGFHAEHGLAAPQGDETAAG